MRTNYRPGTECRILDGDLRSSAGRQRHLESILKRDADGLRTAQRRLEQNKGVDQLYLRILAGSPEEHFARGRRLQAEQNIAESLTAIEQYQRNAQMSKLLRQITH